MNNKNIEEMFREAAEKYALDTEQASDWEKIENALHPKEHPSGIQEKKKSKTRRFVVAYLLLIPLGWFANYFWNSQFNKPSLQKSTTVQTTIPKQEKDISAAINNNTHLIKKQVQAGNHNVSNTPDEKNASVKRVTNKFDSYVPIPAAGTGMPEKLAVLNSKKDAVNTNMDFSMRGLNPLIIKQQQAAATAALPAVPQAAATKKISLKAKEKGFYAGLVFSPDLTFIKFQKIEGIGTSYGLVAGYRLNDKWSIETGVMAERKKYFTSGDHFDKTNEHYLYDKELISVSGNCNMLEIPFTAKYTFARNSKSKWTAALGGAALFMNKAFYRYAIIENGQAEQSDHTYRHTDQHISSAINIGAGYTRNINEKLQLSIEPYYHLPVSGIGKGKLYLSGTGLHIGLTRSF